MKYEIPANLLQRICANLRVLREIIHGFETT